MTTMDANASTSSTLLYSPDPRSIRTVCLGSGRFLRAVLVPALSAAGLPAAIFQTRGRTFLDAALKACADGRACYDYDVDTVLADGGVLTERVACAGAGSLGTVAGKRACLDLVSRLEALAVVGVGVTEAGLASAETKAVRDLADVLAACMKCRRRGSLAFATPRGRLCLVNTDNVPGNGALLKSHLLRIAEERGTADFAAFLDAQVSFHDAMVDRITSHRPGDPLVPRAEPVPAKALVIEDLGGDLPAALLSEKLRAKHGVVVRAAAGQLRADLALKLRVANGTHTAVAHALALTGLPRTDALAPLSAAAVVLMPYLDALVASQILPAAAEFGADNAQATWDDWRGRLTHPKFGLSTFFITQNGAAKGGIRLAPTVREFLRQGREVEGSMALALAMILRFLTPTAATAEGDEGGVHRGWLDPSAATGADEDVVYADGLRYNLHQKWYEFRCTCQIRPEGAPEPLPLPRALAGVAARQPGGCEPVVRAYLLASEGGNLAAEAVHPATCDAFDALAAAVAALYARLAAGEACLAMLRDMAGTGPGGPSRGLAAPCRQLADATPLAVCRGDRPLHYRAAALPDDCPVMRSPVGSTGEEVRRAVFAEVAATKLIDLHTHLLPPSHGALCLWGIDELLTYHYLVAEFFMTAPAALSPEEFYSYSKQKQADVIWDALFIQRSPISEACRGVITTLQALGLHSAILDRDLGAIRGFYASFRSRGQEGAEEYCQLVRKIAGVDYVIMTNIPFDPTESQHWRPKPKVYSSLFRSALRVDPLIAGDRDTVEKHLVASGYERTIEGARAYLRDWCETLKPEYMMASTPHNFVLPEEKKGILSGVKKTGVNQEAMKEPFAFVGLRSPNSEAECNGDDEDVGSVIDENSDLLSEVLMKVCEERDLPVALKIGAHRGVNPALRQAGDGVVAFADTGVLARLCTRFPRVRFLATFLSRNNQHEACVLASKFRNLHIYGCWWFCNNPSIINEITTMRVEMLGTAFTAQHSDARVMDQLIYKWAHSRAVIANVLSQEYERLVESGWTPTRREVRRDVRRLFGGSYEEFMSKSFR